MNVACKREIYILREVYKIYIYKFLIYIYAITYIYKLIYYVYMYVCIKANLQSYGQFNFFEDVGFHCCLLISINDYLCISCKKRENR